MLKKYREVYLINNSNDARFSICKVLNDYETEDEAWEDFKKLATKEITEKDLLKEFDNKEI
jgi:predicted metal-binding protein